MLSSSGRAPGCAPTAPISERHLFIRDARAGSEGRPQAGRSLPATGPALFLSSAPPLLPFLVFPLSSSKGRGCLNRGRGGAVVEVTFAIEPVSNYTMKDFILMRALGKLREMLARKPGGAAEARKLTSVALHATVGL